MTGLRRPCIDCGVLVAGDCRCRSCATRREARRLNRVGLTCREQRRRAQVVRAWRLEHGEVCPGWGDRTAHAVVPPNVLAADHGVPIAASGGQGGWLAVLCRECNGAKGARG